MRLQVSVWTTRHNLCLLEERRALRRLHGRAEAFATAAGAQARGRSALQQAAAANLEDNSASAAPSPDTSPRARMWR